MTPEALREWRATRARSQSNLARRLGVNVATISKWERGIRAIPSYLELALKGIDAEAQEELAGIGEKPGD